MEKTTNEIRKVISFYGKLTGFFKRKNIKAIKTTNAVSWVSYHILLDGESASHCVIYRYKGDCIVSVTIYYNDGTTKQKMIADTIHYEKIKKDFGNV